MNIRPYPDQIKQPDRPKLADIMGPGLITGATDDDPSGIATYSQAGAQFGHSLGWTLLLVVVVGGGSQAQQRWCARCSLTFARILRVTCRHCHARASRAGRDQTA